MLAVALSGALFSVSCFRCKSLTWASYLNSKSGFSGTPELATLPNFSIFDVLYLIRLSQERYLSPISAVSCAFKGASCFLSRFIAWFYILISVAPPVVARVVAPQGWTGRAVNVTASVPVLAAVDITGSYHLTIECCLLLRPYALLETMVQSCLSVRRPLCRYLHSHQLRLAPCITDSSRNKVFS